MVLGDCVRSSPSQYAQNAPSPAGRTVSWNQSASVRPCSCQSCSLLPGGFSPLARRSIHRHSRLIQNAGGYCRSNAFTIPPRQLPELLIDEHPHLGLGEKDDRSTVAFALDQRRAQPGEYRPVEALEIAPADPFDGLPVLVEPAHGLFVDER